MSRAVLLAILAVQGRATMLVVEAHDILKPRDDPFLAGRVGPGLGLFDGYAKFGEQFIIRKVTHSQ